MKKIYKKTLVIIINIFIISVLSGNVYAAKYFVSSSGNNSDGSSWANAYTGLQSALGVVADGDTIIVAAGKYTPDVSSRTVAFEMVAGVKVFGGFVGNETINQSTIDNRDFEANESILSGDLLGNDASYLYSDNSYTVVIFDAWDAAMSESTVLDGFTIMSGNANGSSLESAGGGGVYMQPGSYQDCNPLLKNLVIKNNRAKNGAGLYMDAIIDVYGAISPIIENVIFKNNYAYTGSGGGIYLAAAPNSDVDPTFKEVAFLYNQATASGGGAWLLGGYENEPGNVLSTFTNVTFYGNVVGSEGTGGAIYIHGMDGLADPVFNNVIFYKNDETQIFKSVSTGTASPSYNHCLITGSPSTSWNSSIGIDLGSNLDADPLLADPDNGNIGIIEGSPVLNAGDVTYGVNIGYYQGVGITEPDITIVESLTDFGTVEVGNTSTEQTFTITGTNLLNTVTITPPTGFEVSLSSGSGYFEQLYLFPISGALTTTTIYIRFKPTTTGEHNGNVTVNTPGTAEQQIAVTAYAGSNPGISVIGNQNACLGAGKNFAFTVSDDNLSNLTFDISVTDETILPKVNTEVTGSNGSYNLFVEPIKIGVTAVTVKVIDGDLNESSESFDLTVNSSPELTIDFTQRACYGDQAEIMIGSTGGTGTIQYSLNDGGYSLQTYFYSLSDGDYKVTAIDDLGCTDTSEIYTVSNPTYLMGSADVIKEVTCTDDEDATIRVQGSGGWGDYEYSMNGIDFQTETDFTNLSSGDYQFTVKDKEGCMQVIYSYVINPDILSINYITVDDNNSINIVAYGGWEPLMYALNDGAYQSESYFNNLDDGTYTAYVKDDNGCIVSDVVNITSTGIDDLISDFKLEVYPIPTSEYVYFDVEKLDDKIISVDIYNLNGQKQTITDMNEAISGKVNVQSLNYGVYILVIKLDNNKKAYEKIYIH